MLTTIAVHNHLITNFGSLLGPSFVESLQRGEESTLAQKVEEIAAKTFTLHPFIPRADLARARPPSLDDLCGEPYQFFLNRTLLPLGLERLNVCCCRRLTGTARITLEEGTRELVSLLHPKEDPLTVVSVGPGGCYQELVYLAKFIQDGYTDIHLVLIDPETMPTLELRRFCESHLPPCRITITAYDSLRSYEQEASNTQRKLQPHVLLLIDISDNASKVHRITQLYKYAFLSFAEKNLIPINTVIAYTDVDQAAIPQEIKIVCGVYRGDRKLSHLSHSLTLHCEVPPRGRNGLLY